MGQRHPPTPTHDHPRRHPDLVFGVRSRDRALNDAVFLTRSQLAPARLARPDGTARSSDARARADIGAGWLRARAHTKMRERTAKSARDLAGLDAGRADVKALRGAADRCPDALDVGIPAPVRLLFRPGHIVAEAWVLSADVTHRSHWSSLPLDRISQPATGQPS